MRYTEIHHKIFNPVAHPPYVLIWLWETQDLAKEMGSLSFKELSAPHFSMPAHFMSKNSGPRLYV